MNTDETSALPGDDHGPPVGPVDQVIALLYGVKDAVEDIRKRLQETSKSHFTVEEIAKMTGRKPYTVRMWIKENRIEAERIPGTGPRGRLLIPRSEINKLIASGKAAHIPATVKDADQGCHGNAR